MLEFKPTKAWLQEHKFRPKECLYPEKPCHCVLDHFEHRGYGFCVGIVLPGECTPEIYDLDLIRFCERVYDTEENGPVCFSRQWHPNEAQLVSTYLSFAAMNLWHLLPDYRKQLGTMLRVRGRRLNRGANDG